MIMLYKYYKCTTKQVSYEDGLAYPKTVNTQMSMVRVPFYKSPFTVHRACSKIAKNLQTLCPKGHVQVVDDIERIK